MNTINTSQHPRVLIADGGLSRSLIKQLQLLAMSAVADSGPLQDTTPAPSGYTPIRGKRNDPHRYKKPR